MKEDLQQALIALGVLASAFILWSVAIREVWR